MAARFFRGLFGAYDLHEVHGVYVAVPTVTVSFRLSSPAIARA